MQFAPGERGLQHVPRIHRPLGLAGAHHGVQFIDEQDDLAFLFGEIVQDRLQPLLEFPAKFRARDQGAQVERQNALVAKPFRHFAVDDALRQSLDDGGLADARLADQHRIVLGAPLQYLNGAANLIVAPDHRIELARRRALSEVDAVFFQRLAVFLGPGVLDFRAAAHFVDGLLDGRARGAVRLEQAPDLAPILARREHEQFARNELVAALLCQLVGDIQQLVEVIAEQHLAGRTLDLRHPLQSAGQIRTQFRHLDARLLQQRPGGAALLVEQRGQQVHRLDVLIVAPDGERLGIRQCRLKFGRQLVHSHSNSLEVTL